LRHRKPDNKPEDAKSKDNAGNTAAKPDDEAADRGAQHA
jgi:hypothetical protein